VLYNGNFSFQFQFQHALLGVEGKLELIYLFIRFVRKKWKSYCLHQNTRLNSYKIHTWPM